MASAAAATAAVALSAAEPFSPHPSLGAAGGEGDEDEEDTLFFDTREYCQTSDYETCGGGGSSDRDRDRDRGGDGSCGDDDPDSFASDGGGGRSDGVGGIGGVGDDGGKEGGANDDDDLLRGEEGAPTGLSSVAVAPSDLPAPPLVVGGGLPPAIAAADAVTVIPDVDGDSSVTDRHDGDDSDAEDAQQGKECSVLLSPEAAEVAVGATGAAKTAEAAEAAEAVEAVEAAEAAEAARAAGVAKSAGAADASDEAGEAESTELSAPAGMRATTQQMLDAAATSTAAAGAAAGETEPRDHHNTTNSTTNSACFNGENMGEAQSLQSLDIVTGDSPDQDSDITGLPFPQARREGPIPAAAAAAAVATPAVASPVAVARPLAAQGPPRLLRTGAAVRVPRLPSSGPVTGDMLEQQTGQAGVYRWREVLVADMEAFRRENGSAAAFADFVRWYRPECWQVRRGGGVAGGEAGGGLYSISCMAVVV